MNTTLDHAMSSAEHAAHEVQAGAKHGRASLLEIGTQVLKFVGALRALEVDAVDSVLGKVGLRRRQSAAMPLAWFAAGAVLGGGVALALAPTSGHSLRKRVARFLDSNDAETHLHKPPAEGSKDGKSDKQGSSFEPVDGSQRPPYRS